MSRASHVAMFAAGAILGAAALAAAVPKDDVARFRSFDAFAQALALVETNYVDPVDEQKLLARRHRAGCCTTSTSHSTYLPPSRYQKMRQDTEGEFGGVGVVLAPGLIDDARPSVPPYPIVDEIEPARRPMSPGCSSTIASSRSTARRPPQAGKELKEAGAWEAKLRGASGTRVTLGILRVGWKEPRAFTLVRAQVKQPTVRDKVLEPGIGYLAISRFSESTGRRRRAPR